MREIQLAGCVIKDDQDRLLLLHRNTAKRRHWEIPGGKLEYGESAAKAAARELLEEMGVVVKVERMLGTRSFVENGNKMVYTWFLAKIADGEPQPQPLEPDTHDAVGYLRIADLSRMADELSPNARNLVNEIEAGNITW
jgi:8-oxo-dGTP diphosphatase